MHFADIPASAWTRKDRLEASEESLHTYGSGIGNKGTGPYIVHNTHV